MTSTISVRTLPGRVFTHDGKRITEGTVLALPEAQAQGLVAAGHVEPVAAVPSAGNAGGEVADKEPEE